MPACPMLLPAVKLNCSCAVEQLVKLIVAMPTGLLVCDAGVAVSNTPPVVSKSVSAIARLPTMYGADPVNQRWPAAPAACPEGAYVYHAKNTIGDSGFTSNTKPCPEVAGANQLPDSAKSAFCAGAPPTTHVTLGVMRVIGMTPARPLPSLNV